MSLFIQSCSTEQIKKEKVESKAYPAVQWKQTSQSQGTIKVQVTTSQQTIKVSKKS